MTPFALKNALNNVRATTPLVHNITNYVTVNDCANALLAIGAAAAILKLHPEDYMIYLLLAALLSVIPLLMLIFGQVRVRYPSVICVACSIISLAALAIFFGRSLLIEIKKRLHF